jgi:hypothetical protein
VSKGTPAVETNKPYGTASKKPESSAAAASNKPTRAKTIVIGCLWNLSSGSMSFTRDGVLLEEAVNVFESGCRRQMFPCIGE